MIFKQKLIWFTFFYRTALLLAFCTSIAYSQAVVDFGGTWNTVTSKGKKIVITLQSVRRVSVTGTYERNGLTAGYQPLARGTEAFIKVSFTSVEPGLQSASSITGTVTDNVLRFKWREDGGQGAGRFTMSADGQSFEGTFSRTDNPDDTSGGTWNGTRAPSFAGAWQTTSGGQIQFPDLILQQSGRVVTGQLSANRPDIGLIRDGVIDGMTLRFKIIRPGQRLPNGLSLPDQFIGTGELVMEKGSKSFKGTILGGAVSGTRLGR